MELALIFKPYSQKGLTLNNRMFMTPITRSCSANTEPQVLQRKFRNGLLRFQKIFLINLKAQ